MRTLAVIGKTLFIFLPMGSIGTLLALPLLEWLIAAAGLDLFEATGSFKPWMLGSVGFLWMLGSVATFFAYTRVNRIGKSYFRIPAQLIFARLALASLGGGMTLVKTGAPGVVFEL